MQRPLITYTKVNQTTNTHVLCTLKSLKSRGNKTCSIHKKKYGIYAVKLKTMKFVLRNATKLCKVNKPKNFITVSVKTIIYNRKIEGGGRGCNLSKVRY